MSRVFQAGNLRYRVTYRSAANVYNISVTLPDGSTVTNLPTTQGAEMDLGHIARGPVTLTLNDTSFGGATWNDSNSTHCRVNLMPNGYSYYWDDLGGGSGSDGDFNDIVIELYTPIDNICNARVAVFKPDGVNLISYVPRRRGVQWLDEVNAPGTGSFAVHLDDIILAAHPDLLDQYNIVKIYLGGVAIKAWVIEETNPTTIGAGEAADRWVQVNGRGVLSVLETAIVYPEYGLREFTGEDRYFNYASASGVWLDPAEWTVPIGVRWDADTTARHTYPKNWPDPAAQYLWSTSPNSNAAPGVNWFRSEFTLATATSVIIYATADNYFTASLDGQIIMTSGTNPSSFRTRYEWRTTLSAGTHTLAAVVTNLAGSATPAGFIATIYQTSASGSATSANVFRTTPINTAVKGYGSAPGWTGAAMLQQLIVEAQARGVTAVLPITFSFTNSHDSFGIPWTDVQDRTIKVGTTDLADLAAQIVELGMDIELDSNFVLHAWKKRGIDRSNWVAIRPNRDVVSSAGSVRAGKLRNQAVLKYDGGWIELFSAASKEEYGRREVGISLGTSASTDQTILAGAALVRESARPEQTIPLSYTCLSGPQPYANFSLGDVIMTPDVWSGMTKSRLMSISGSEQEDSYVTWDLDFYPEIPDDAIDSVVVATGGTYQDPSGLYQSEVLSDSPWAYWRLKETSGNLLDTSGHVRTMIVEAGAAGLYNQGGPIDKAYLWGNTAAQYAHTNNHFVQGIVTVEAWVYITNRPASGKATILGMAESLNDTAHDKDLGIYADGRLFFYVFNGTAHEITSGSPLALNTWHHVVGSVGSRGLRLYINGALVTNNPAVTNSYTGSQLVFMHNGGSGYSTAARFFIAEPAIYFQQLLDSRITSHFDAATP